MAIIKVGDDLIEEETGEYAGPADTTLPDELDSESDLLAFLHRLSNAEARLESKRIQLDAVIENCRKMLKKEEDRVAWLRRRYELQARLIAMDCLPRTRDGKLASKTFTCPWGQVQFRELKPTIEVLDEDAALQWSEKYCPDAVKVKKSVLITPLKAHFIDGEHLKAELPEGFGFIESRQSMSITTVKPVKEA